MAKQFATELERELYEALNAIVAPHYDEDGLPDVTTASMVVGHNGHGELRLKGSFLARLEAARAALAKATETEKNDGR